MPPALSGLIPTMGPDAAGGNWSRDLRPLPAGKKSLSKFGPTSPPKRLLLEKRRKLSGPFRRHVADEHLRACGRHETGKLVSPSVHSFWRALKKLEPIRRLFDTSNYSKSDSISTG